MGTPLIARTPLAFAVLPALEWMPAPNAAVAGLGADAESNGLPVLGILAGETSCLHNSILAFSALIMLRSTSSRILIVSKAMRVRSASARASAKDFMSAS